MAAQDVKPVPTDAIKNVSGSNGAEATAYPPIVVKTTRAEIIFDKIRPPVTKIALKNKSSDKIKICIDAFCVLTSKPDF